MTYTVVHKDGSNDTAFPLDQLANLVTELNSDDDQYACVALSHSTEWCLSLHTAGILLWENNLSELSDCKYMKSISADRAIVLMTLLAQGHIDDIKKEPWQNGDPIYGF